MLVLAETQANEAWAQFATIFTNLGLNNYYDMDKLHDELLSSPCGISEDAGTAYKGALLMHINMLMGIAERMTKMISGTFQVDKNSLLKVCCIMHLSKRYMYAPCTEDWKIRGGRFFEFAKLEGNLKSGERSALEALNNGVKLTPTEYEAIKILDGDEDNTKNPFKSILAIIIKQANELAYAIERERYNKAKNVEK